ncbi:hypothetical protein Pth03_18160 [Planotetraspora thailandica]|uniref:Sensor domain-containing protein n=1 Tax=Planotetraspora thailandica TaxID=487172 RepID=A0A8J3V0S9_9ACTN|nr:sensor domain-containing protein [Planotetraspora thailandica]GII53427.1 hypothetical protein Pth03_18160 [Planotetraspora thailandica]
MNIPVHSRLRMRTVAVGLVVLTAGGCGGTAGGEKPAAGAPSSTAPAVKVLNGTQLNHLLLPAKAMPKGFTIDPSGTQNSGSDLTPRTDEPVPASKLCGTFLETAWIRVAGIGQAAFAQNQYVGPDGNGQIAQEIDSFHGEDAEKAMAQVKKALANCASFTSTSDGATARVKMVSSKLPGVGDEAVKVIQSSPDWQGGETLVAARTGNVVVTAFYNSVGADKGSAVVKMTKTIVDGVESRTAS